MFNNFFIVSSHSHLYLPVICYWLFGLQSSCSNARSTFLLDASARVLAEILSYIFVITCNSLYNTSVNAFALVFRPFWSTVTSRKSRSPTTNSSFSLPGFVLLSGYMLFENLATYSHPSRLSVRLPRTALVYICVHLSRTGLIMFYFRLDVGILGLQSSMYILVLLPAHFWWRIRLLSILTTLNASIRVTCFDF